MGREKDRQIEEEERGWHSITRRLVCNSCVSDDRLLEYFSEHGKPAVCEYCGADPEEDEAVCVPFDELMNVVGEAVNWAYASADHECIPYESREGGYAFPDRMLDTCDLLIDQVGLEVACDDVLKDMLAALPDQTWCDRDFWSLSLNQALRLGWERFCEKMKYETRFVFTTPEPLPNEMQGEALTSSLAPLSESSQIEAAAEPDDSGGFEHVALNWAELPPGDPDFGIEYDRQEGIPVHEMLDAIGQVLRRLELVQTLPVETAIFRVRTADKGCTLTGAADLGPPSREKATQPNRMSPAGIVMFYGAMDRETALVETFQPGRDGAEKKGVWVSCFRSSVPLRVLDLTRLPPVPSIFDANRDLMNGIGFLHSFVDDLVQPISGDGREHIDYVPTQIVSEYVRHRFQTEEHQSVKGILYRSSKRPSGIACVLFADQTNCGVPSDDGYETEQLLRLDEDRTEILDGALAGDWHPTVE